MTRNAWWMYLLVGCTTETPEEIPSVEVVSDVVLFSFPVAERERIHRLVGVDHDGIEQPDGPMDVICEDYLGRGFPHCYDSHDGSDYMLDGGFEAMDSGSAMVIAAAAGIVTMARDGHYDRCFGTLSGIDCDGNPEVANAVTLEHVDGSRTKYWHLMNGSVAVEVGETVEAGTPLGLIGSSGRSSMPHLHFEVVDSDGEAIDPYSASGQDSSLWCEQGPPDGLPGDCGGDSSGG